MNHSAERQIRDLHNGVPNPLPESLQWIWSRENLPVPFPVSQHAPWEKPRSSTLGSNKTALELPTKAALRSFLNAFTTSSMHRIFPVVDSSLFSQTIQVAYSKAKSPQASDGSAQACILSFMAMVSSLYHLDPSYNGNKLPSIPRETYIAHARALLPAIIQEPLNLDALQAAISLVGDSLL